MRIIRIASQTFPDDALVDVRFPDQTFKGYVRPQRGTPEGMIVVQNQQTGERTVVPVSVCSINEAWQKRMENLRATEEYNAMSRDQETFDKMGRLYQDANP